MEVTEKLVKEEERWAELYVFCYVKDSAEVTKEVVVMIVMKDAT